MINIKNCDPSNIKWDRKSYQSILFYYIDYGTPNSVKPLYRIINNANGYIEKNNNNNNNNGNKYLTLVTTDKNREKLKK